MGQAASISRPATRHGLVLGVLALGGAAYALLQSLVVPALTVLQQDLNASTSGVAWIFTAYLLAASVVTPIAGRLGDIFGKKRVLVVALAGLAAGSLMAAVVSTLSLMIVARVIQGLGGAIFPLAFGIIRDEFPPARIAGSIGLMSGLLGIGGGLGIVLSGIILDNLSYHWLFWIPLVVTSIAMLATIFFVPESPVRAPSGVNWGGAVLLSGWLTALLLATSQAHVWGWVSPKTVGLMALSAVLAVLWVRSELRSRHPLVDMSVMRIRPVWTTNLAAFLLGFGMYSAFVLIPQFVQVPDSTGYGLGATVTQAGLYLVPSTIAMLVFAPLAGRLSNSVGPKVPLVLGTIVTGLAFVVLVLESSSWEIYFASLLLGTGIGFAFASLANLIVEAVPRDQTGIATGMNTVMRTIGGAIGAQVAVSILATSTLSGGYPSEHGYTVTFAVCFVVMVAAVAASLLVPGRKRESEAPHVVPVAEPLSAVE